MQDPKLSHFPPEREQKLANLWRYRIFEVMYYRPNVLLHSSRISWWVEEIAPLAKKHLKGIDIEKARLAALVHDDAEMITGDIPSHHKAMASDSETAKIDKEEKLAIDKLAKIYPKEVDSYSYHDLLMQTFHKKSTEGQLVSYLDKLDAYCEGMHEVLAGNITYLQTILNYARVFERAVEKYPYLKPLLSDKTSPMTNMDRPIYWNFVPAKYVKEFNKPHTKKSLETPSDFPFYNLWRKLMIKHMGEKGAKELTKQKEFLK